MAKTISELRNQSIQVRDASAAGENTATRVGTVLNDIVGHIEDYENTQSSNNSSQDAKIDGVKSLLNAEIARAKTEESNLSNMIGTERTERQASVSREETARIQADNDEKTARQQADNAEQDARIKADNDEKTARENADITLRTMIQTEVRDREKAVAAEAARAKAAEQANAQAIADETARAMAAEEAETTRATTEEERLQGEIDNTIDNLNSLEDKVNSNHDRLTDEVARLDLTDNEIKADLDTETTRAKAADEANAQAITDEKNRAMAAEQAIIFDVSAHNNGTVFESLPALLGNSNLDTLIPVSLRHGGMTIRFIQGSEQSSDNKYVQYRLMTNAWSTTVTDWQGVDDEPTAGSDNLVKSGGVFNDISPLKNSVKQENDSIFVVVDKNSVISLQIDSDGVKVRKIIICDSDGNTLKEINASVLLISDIEDSVESSSSVKVLSAKQGNLLDGRISNLEEIIKDNVTDELQVKDSNGYYAFKIDSGGLVHLNKVMGHGNGLFAIEDENGYYAFLISNDGKTNLVISKDSFVRAFYDYRQYLDLSAVKTDLELLLPPYLFTVANYCYSDNPLRGDYSGNPSKRNYAPVMYMDRLVRLDSDGFAPNVCFLGGTTSMRFSNTSNVDTVYGGQFDGKSVERTIENRIVGEKYNDYDVSIPLHVAKNTNLLDEEQTKGRSLNILCLGDSETDQGEWSSYIRKLVLMDNIDYKKKTDTQIDVLDVNLIGTRHDANNESFTYRGESINLRNGTGTGNFNEGLSSWGCCTYLRHAKLYTWASVTYNNVSKSILHCAWRELGLYTSKGREYSGTNEDKAIIANTCSGFYTLTEDDLDGWVWNNNRNAIGLSSVEWESATAQNKADLLTYLNVTLLASPENRFYSKDKVVETNGEYAFDWNAYYARYKNRDIDGNVLLEQGTSVISDSYVCTPDYVLMNLGTNDTAFFPDDAEARVGVVYYLAQIIQSQIGCQVIVFTPSFTSRLYMSGAVDGYAEAQRKYAQTINRVTDFTHNMLSKFGTLTQQEANGVLFCPTFWTQRFGPWSSNSYVEIGEDVTEIGTIINDNEVHPSKYAYDDWGYMLYSMIQYLLR